VKLRRVVNTLLAPVSALVFALLVSSIAVLLIHKNPITAFSDMARFGVRLDSIILTIDEAIPFFLAGLAVAVGIKMGRFNIGV